MSVVARFRVDEFCETGSGGTPARDQWARYYEGGTIPWVKSGELREQIIHATEEHVTDAALAETNVKVVPAGAILLAMYGATVGRIGVLGVPATTNQAICHLVPRPDRADVRYLFHALQGKVPEMVGRATGGAQPNINQGIVRGLEIALPPLEKQRHVAAILDQAEALRAQRRAAIAQLDSLGQAVFLEMFGHVLTNDREWPADKTLGDVADIVSGITKGRDLKGKSARAVPYLAVVNVQDKALNLKVVKSIEATEDEIQRYRLEKDDLLLTEGGDPDKLGRGTLWNDELTEAIHQNHIFRVRLNSGDIAPVFLNWLVGSQRGKRYFLKSAKQTTGIASINMTQLRGFPLLQPPVALQEAFAQRIQAIEQMKTVHVAALSRLDELFASLQHRAFRGEL